MHNTQMMTHMTQPNCHVCGTASRCTCYCWYWSIPQSNNVLLFECLDWLGKCIICAINDRPSHLCEDNLHPDRRKPPAAPEIEAKENLPFPKFRFAVRAADVRRMLREDEERDAIEQEQELHLCKD
jgi:hypothetical protein